MIGNRRTAEAVQRIMKEKELRKGRKHVDSVDSQAGSATGNTGAFSIKGKYFRENMNVNNWEYSRPGYITNDTTDDTTDDTTGYTADDTTGTITGYKINDTTGDYNIYNTVNRSTSQKLKKTYKAKNKKTAKREKTAGRTRSAGKNTKDNTGENTGINMNTKTGKEKNKKSVKRKILTFLLFELIFTVLTAPFLVFYGPFEEVKRTVVGASWNTLRHQYIARAFLSDEAIARILGGSYAVDPTTAGEEIQILKFGNNHNDKIEVFNIDGGDFKGKLMVIHDPLRVKVGYSSQLPKSGETTSMIAKKNGAVAAINAGGFIDSGWTGTGGTPMGFIISNGEVLFNSAGSETVKQNTVAFTKDGMLIVGRHSIKSLKKMGVTEGISFGPPLIVNGKPTITKGDGGWGIAPRTAIGQKKTGEVLFLVIDGRSINSIGATLRDCQDILMEYGAVNASNLDGGSSTTMYFNGKVINKPSDKLGERTVPTAFIVTPALGGSG